MHSLSVLISGALLGIFGIIGAGLVGLSHALGGVAETGTLLLTSGPDNPTSINFLPDNHIIIVKG